MFEKVYKWNNPVRAAGVAISDFTHCQEQVYIDLDGGKHEKLERLDTAVDNIRKKYGNKNDFTGSR